jgi:hypothetical protein
MFPHEYDRHRVMAFLLRQARESIRIKSDNAKNPKKLTQSGLAERITERSRIGGVSQPSISNIEGLESISRLLEGGGKPGTRETLIEIATLGLELKQEDVDALLWLFDFNPLKDDELNYCKRYDPQCGTVTYTSGELRLHVLKLLDKWLAKRNAKPVRTVTARMIMKWDEPAQLEFREDLRKMEAGPGQRMIFGKYPSILTFPYSFEAVDSDLTNAGRFYESQVMDKRRQKFLGNLATHGERCIHASTLIAKYLALDFVHRLNWQQRREQIENLIDLLSKYEHYQVALVEVPPNNEIVIKSTEAACLRGTERDTYNLSSDTLICGPLYVYWYDVTTVFSLYRQFEQAWDSIPAEWRDKEFVINFLRNALDASQ